MMVSGVQSFSRAIAGTTLLVLRIAGTQAKAATVTFTGDTSTTGVPTWNRPDETPPYALTGTNVPFLSQPFYVDTADAYNFLSSPQPPSSWDNFTLIYQNSFSASNPQANIVIANDNFQGSVARSGFNGVPLTANTQYFFVTTGSSNFDSGQFTNTINSTTLPANTGTITLGFSPNPTPVPFEFSPGLGISILGTWFGISQLRSRMGKHKGM